MWSLTTNVADKRKRHRSRQSLTLLFQMSTTVSVGKSLYLGIKEAASVLSHYPLRYRNGKLGSKHCWGKNGYQHRRTHRQQVESIPLCIIDLLPAGVGESDGIKSSTSKASIDRC